MTQSSRPMLKCLAVCCLALLCLLQRCQLTAAVRQVSFSIVEEQPEGTVVGNLLDTRTTSSDRDAAGSFGIIPNKADRSSGASYFNVDSKGNVVIKKRIDRDSLERCSGRQLHQPLCTLTFQAFRMGDAAQMMYIDVIVTVLDINDNAPSWSRFSLEARLSEDHPEGRPFKVEAARDPDFGVNGTVTYKLHDPTGTFSIVSGNSYSSSYLQDSDWIRINVNKPLDREHIEKYNLTLIAKDSAAEPRSASIRLFVTIEDVNDHAPKFNQSHYRVSIPETTSSRSLILQLHASDPDKGRNGDVEYSFADGIPSTVRDYFRLDRSHGQLYLKQALDYDVAETRLFEFAVVAKDMAQAPRSSSAQVVIVVEDENDCRPQLTVYQFSKHVGMRETTKLIVPEDTPPNSPLGFASVIDNDSGDGGEADCEIENPMRRYFKLNLLPERPDQKQKTYQIISRESFDRETLDSYRVPIVCRDRGTPPQSSAFELFVDIQDINDQQPTFTLTRYEFLVKENLPALSHVGSVTATDGDAMQNGRVSYEIDPGSLDAKLFGINSRGEIQTAAPLDREQKPELSFKVIARDHGSPQLNASVQVLVRVQDENDAEPKFGQSFYTFELFEGQPPDTPVGNLTATDDDIGLNANLTYAIHSAGSQIAPFRILSLADGWAAQIRTTATIDRESGALAASGADEKSYTFTVRAIDRGYRPLTGTCVVKVIIKDVNDNSPEWIVPSGKLKSVNVSRYEEAGRVIINLRAVDPDDGDFGRIRYTVQEGDTDGLFALDPRDGALKILRPLPRVGTYRLKLAATDCVGCQVSHSSVALLTVSVLDQPMRDSRRDNRAGEGAGRRRFGGFNEHLIVGLVGCTVAIVLLAICAILLARCFFVRVANSKRATDKRQREMDDATLGAHQEALLFADPGHQHQQLPAHPYPLDATGLRRPAIMSGSPHDSGKGGSIDGTSCDVTGGRGGGGGPYQVATLANFDKLYIQQQQQQQQQHKQRRQQQQQQQYTTLVPTSVPSRQLPQYYDVVRGSGGELASASAAAAAAAAPTDSNRQQQQPLRGTLGRGGRPPPHLAYQASSFV